MSYRGVEINFYHDAATTGSDDVFGFSTAYQSLLDTLSPGESGSMTIRFADYYDEYPFEFSIDLPGVNYDPLVNWQDASADSEWLGERAQAALGRFFRIPVLQDEYVELGIDKNMDGTGSGRSISSVMEGDRFWMNVESVITDDTCFFWFGNRTDKDRLVDTSRIPGGYGIYMLPYGAACPGFRGQRVLRRERKRGLYRSADLLFPGRSGNTDRASWADAGQVAAFAPYS